MTFLWPKEDLLGNLKSLLRVRRLGPHEGLGRGDGPRVPLGDGDGGAVLLEPLVRVALVVLRRQDIFAYMTRVIRGVHDSKFLGL